MPDKHGMSNTPIYAAWKQMLGRCRNPSNKDFRYYGGRGVLVCDRWLVFSNFIADMGPRPEGMTLDRIDPDGNYEPGNCRWASRADQTANRRTIRSHRPCAYLRPSGRWQSVIQRGRCRVSLGTFLTKQEAEAAYLRAMNDAAITAQWDAVGEAEKAGGSDA